LYSQGIIIGLTIDVRSTIRCNPDEFHDLNAEGWSREENRLLVVVAPKGP
jgi:hypothetical protein